MRVCTNTHYGSTQRKGRKRERELVVPTMGSQTKEKVGEPLVLERRNQFPSLREFLVGGGEIRVCERKREHLGKREKWECLWI